MYLRSKPSSQTDIFATRTSSLTYIYPKFSESKGPIKISNTPFKREYFRFYFYYNSAINTNIKSTERKTQRHELKSLKYYVISIYK